MAREKRYKALVIYFFGGIGDRILSLPFLQLLGKKYNFEISYLTYPDNRAIPFVQKIPLIKEIYTHRFAPSQFRYSYLGTLFCDLPQDIRFMRKLVKKNHFDFVFWIEYPASRSSLGIYKCLLLFFVPARWKATFTRGMIEKFPGIKLVSVDDSCFIPYQMARLLPVEEKEPFEKADLSFLLESPPSPFTQEILKRGKFLIVIHPFSTNYPFLRISIERWNLLIGKIKEIFSDSVILLLGSNNDFLGEEERTLWLNICEKADIQNLIGMTSFTDLAHLISRCSLFIGIDSGISHIAWAFNKPRLIFYRFPMGSAPPAFYLEDDITFVFVPQVNCFPCGMKYPKHCRSKRCLDSYDWQKVFLSLQKISRDRF